VAGEGVESGIVGPLLLPVLIVDAAQGPYKHLRGKTGVLATSQHLIKQGV
jgi:hypothetical protein